MATFRLTSLPALVGRLWTRKGVATLGILLACLPLTVVLTLAADRLLGDWRPGLAGRANPAALPMPTSLSPAIRTKMQRAASWDERRDVGSEAPDFTLMDAAGRSVSLSSFRGKRPVVLVFGSFGCNLFCDALGPPARTA